MKHTASKRPGWSFLDSYRALALILALFITSGVFAQYDSTKKVQPIGSYGFAWKNGKFLNSLVIPAEGELPTLARRDTGAIAYFSGNIHIWAERSGILAWYEAGTGSGGGSDVTLVGDSLLIVDGDTLRVKFSPNKFETDLSPAYAFQDGDTVRFYPRQYIQDSVLITKSGDTLFFPNGDTAILGTGTVVTDYGIDGNGSLLDPVRLDSTGVKGLIARTARDSLDLNLVLLTLGSSGDSLIVVQNDSLLQRRLRDSVFISSTIAPDGARVTRLDTAAAGGWIRQIAKQNTTFSAGQILWGGSNDQIRGSSGFTRDSATGRIVVNETNTTTAQAQSMFRIGGTINMRSTAGDTAYGLRVNPTFFPNSTNKYMVTYQAGLNWDTTGVGTPNTGIIPTAYSASTNGAQWFSVNLVSTLSPNQSEIILRNGTSGTSVARLRNTGTVSIGSVTSNNFDLITGGSTRMRIATSGKIRIGDSNTPISKLHLAGGETTPNNAPLQIDSGGIMTITQANVIEYDGRRLYHTNRDSIRGDIGITRTLIDGGATLTIDDRNSFYVFSGTTATWTLPAVTGRANRLIRIKNKGSGDITLNTVAAGNDIYDTSAVNTLTITPGSSITLICDGTHWNKM